MYKPPFNITTLMLSLCISITEKLSKIKAFESLKRILLNIKSKETLRNSYLNPAIENGLIRMTLPDKPNSKNQKYIKQ
jgi:hypothetical protein